MFSARPCDSLRNRVSGRQCGPARPKSRVKGIQSLNRRPAVARLQFVIRSTICLDGLSAGLDRMSKIAPLKFMQEVRSEVSKVEWPTRRELLVTTGMVFLLSAIASLFFFLVDQVIRLGLAGILGLF